MALLSFDSPQRLHPLEPLLGVVAVQLLDEVVDARALGGLVVALANLLSGYLRDGRTPGEEEQQQQQQQGSMRRPDGARRRATRVHRPHDPGALKRTMIQSAISWTLYVGGSSPWQVEHDRQAAVMARHAHLRNQRIDLRQDAFRKVAVTHRPPGLHGDLGGTARAGMTDHASANATSAAGRHDDRRSFSICKLRKVTGASSPLGDGVGRPSFCAQPATSSTPARAATPRLGATVESCRLQIADPRKAGKRREERTDDRRSNRRHDESDCLSAQRSVRQRAVLSCSAKRRAWRRRCEPRRLVRIRTGSADDALGALRLARHTHTPSVRLQEMAEVRALRLGNDAHQVGLDLVGIGLLAPTSLPSSERPIGDAVEILPLDGVGFFAGHQLILTSSSFSRRAP